MDRVDRGERNVEMRKDNKGAWKGTGWEGLFGVRGTSRTWQNLFGQLFGGDEIV